MATDEAPQGTRTERFAEYIREAAKEAGYDVDSPRGGGKTALARDTGMSPSSVGRMLAGQTMPDANFLERIADALGVPLLELLVRSGVVSHEVVSAGLGVAPPSRPEEDLTLSDEASRLGIRSPAGVAMFEAMVKRLREADQQYLRTTGEPNARKAG